MPNQNENVLASQIDIKVAGSLLSEEVMDGLMDVVVDQHAYLPHMFTIRLYDPELVLLEGGPFDLTKEVEITAINPDSNQRTLWIKGEITALEPVFSSGLVAYLVVRGYDRSHRLYRETRSKAFLNKKDSDLATQFAGSVGLSAQVDATSTVYDHIFQDNRTDLAFLMERAWRIGYECFAAEGKLYFRKPQQNASGPTLEWGTDLSEFLPRVTLAEQVDEVIVKGWDVQKQEPIIGQAKTGTLYPKVGESKNGAAWAKSFGTGKVVIVDQPVVSQAEANVIAQARLNEISGVFVDAEGIAHRRPDITAGKTVTLQGLGKRLSGTYLVTQATHTYDRDGYKTTFTVSGSRTGMMAEELNRQRPQQRWPGVVTAIVTNTDDPKNWGRIKLKFPWMTNDAESDWARVVGIGAGPEAGFFVLPEVGDEVLVAFEHGDFGRPFVLGAMWNGKHAIPPENAGAAQGEKPLVRSWHSRTGHWMAMYDNADNKVEIVTAGGHSATFDDANKKVEILTASGHKVTMDDQGKKLEILSSGGHKVTLDDNGRKVIIQSSGDVEVKAGANMKLNATANLDLQANGNVNIQATGLLAIKSNGPLDVQSSAITSIKGTLIKLN